jgi:hypothetical protein
MYAVHDRALECCKSTLIVVTARCLADTMKGKGNEHCTREAKDVVGDVVCRFEGALELSFAAAEHQVVWRKQNTPISLISTFSRTFICHNAGPSRKTRLVAQRCMVATSPRGAQWWACQRARCGRELPRG